MRRWEGVCQKEQLPRPYPTSAAGQSAYQVSNFGNRQKRLGPSAKSPSLAGGPCQSSRWPPTRDSRAKISGLKDHWRLAPAPPNRGYRRTGRDWMLFKRISCSWGHLFPPPPRGQPGQQAIPWPVHAFSCVAGCGAHRLLQWDFPYETEHSY